MSRNLRREIVIVLGGHVVQLVFTFATGVFIARTLGPNDYGVLNILRNTLGMMALLAPMGLDIALLKYCGSAASDAASLQKMISALRKFVLVINLGVAFLVSAFASGPLMRQLYPYDGFDRLLGVTILGLPIGADIAVMGAVMKSRGQADTYCLLTLYLQSGARLALVGVSAFVAPSLSAFVWINVAQLAVSSLAIEIFEQAQSRRRRSQEKGDATIAWSSIASILKESGWMAVTTFVYGGMRFLDTLILGVYSSAAEVGQYAALSAVSCLVMAYPAAASQSLGPTVARFFHEGRIDMMIDALRDFFRASMMFSCFVFGGVAVFGDRLDLIFGPAYAFDRTLCFLLPLALTMSAVLAPMGYALSMTGRHKVELVIAFLGSATLVISGILLTPGWGAVGASLSVMAGFGVANVIRVAYIGRLFGSLPLGVADFAPFVVSLAAAGLARNVVDSFWSRSFWGTATECLLYAALYAWACFAFLSREDERSMLRGWALDLRRST